MTLEVLALIVVGLVLGVTSYVALNHIKQARLEKQQNKPLKQGGEEQRSEARQSLEALSEDLGENLKEDAPSSEESSLTSGQEAEMEDNLLLLHEPSVAPVLEDVSPQDEHSNYEIALKNTKTSFWGRIQNLFQGDASGGVDWDSIEEVLYTSDLGPKTVQHLMSSLEENLNRADRNNEDLVRATIKSEMKSILKEAQQEDGEQLAGLEYELLDESDKELRPVVWMIIGVNGSGKTTSIGKLANVLAGNGKKVMLAAGDTFRAAADAQLREWSKRANVELFSPENVKDPSAVAFDACKSAVAKNYDHVIVDTAGRLHTQSNLMEELKKMKRVIDKAIPGAPHETLLVIDGNNGQNALLQAKEFHAALGLTGLILTKMDGSTKGGVVLGVAHELKVPIKRIGIGEKIEDLRAFDIDSFVDAII